MCSLKLHFENVNDVSFVISKPNDIITVMTVMADHRYGWTLDMSIFALNYYNYVYLRNAINDYRILDYKISLWPVVIMIFRCLPNIFAYFQI